MKAPSGPAAGPALRTLLDDGALAGEWALDPSRSSIRLKGRGAWGVAVVNGAFREVSGHGTVAADGGIKGTIAAAAASVETGNAKRDTRLRSADFFDSANHPHITFTAHGARPSGHQHPHHPRRVRPAVSPASLSGVTGVTGVIGQRLGGLTPGRL